MNSLAAILLRMKPLRSVVWGSRTLVTLGAGLIVGWLVFIVVSIAQTPEPGEATITELAAQLRVAVATGDVELGTRITASPPDGRVKEMLSKLKCGEGLVTEVTQTGAETGRIRVFATGVDCGSVVSAKDKGRWFIDPWADPVRRDS